MTVSTISAAQGYVATRPFTAPVDHGPDADTLKGFVNAFTQRLRESESLSMNAMAGNADPHRLVQALAQTELAVDTAVTIRDKVVEAYQEILRMPV